MAKDYRSEFFRIKRDEFNRVDGAEVERVTQLSRSTIWRRVKEGTFPPALPGLTRRKWMLEDVETYLAHQGAQSLIRWQPPL